jgi:uncharacterized protein YccT (UPF0319 family)
MEEYNMIMQAMPKYEDEKSSDHFNRIKKHNIWDLDALIHRILE